MNVDYQLIQALKVDEGYEAKPYRDTQGKLTIGIGRNLDDVGISPAEADMLLQNDIDSAMRSLDIIYPSARKLDQARYHVLVNMTFNMGINKMRQFKKMFAALDQHDYETVSQEMLNSRWAKQVGKRAVRLARIMKGA